VNLKQPEVRGMLRAAYHPPILGKILAPTFALGDPVQHGRQRVRLQEDD
jgi:hypothetical protein